jgi:hypothetical protein
MLALKFSRRSQGKLDMVAFWKEIAQKVSTPYYRITSSDVVMKAPHHSRASWMKFYRRHKHELNHTENDDPLPQVPEKKMRYSRADDVLLAKFFFNKPDGTSDKIFQAFGRLVSLQTFYCSFRSVITFSTHITRGRVGRNTIGFISKRLITLSNDLARAISLTNPIRQLSRERGV